MMARRINFLPVYDELARVVPKRVVFGTAFSEVIDQRHDGKASTFAANNARKQRKRARLFKKITQPDICQADAGTVNDGARFIGFLKCAAPPSSDAMLHFRLPERPQNEVA